LDNLRNLNENGDGRVRLRFSAWDDLRSPATGARIDTTTGRLDYNFTECGIEFAENARYPEEPLCIIQQMSHSKKLGTPVSPHIHWVQNSAEEPNWLIAYRVYSYGETVPAFQLAKFEKTIFAYTGGDLAQITTFPEIECPDDEMLSLELDVILYRDSANTSGLFDGPDTYVGPVLYKEFDIHFEIDGFGSTYEFKK